VDSQELSNELLNTDNDDFMTASYGGNGADIRGLADIHSTGAYGGTGEGYIDIYGDDDGGYDPYPRNDDVCLTCFSKFACT
jgi:hypothetical protein